MLDPYDLFEQAIQQYEKVRPRDLKDAEFFVNAKSFEELQRYAQIPPSDNPFQRHVNTLLGLRVRVDDNLPDGVVQLLAETPLDRAIRRASERGQVVNVMPPVEFPAPVLPPAPDPTLKALLKHWLKKWKELLKWHTR